MDDIPIEPLLTHLGVKNLPDDEPPWTYWRMIKCVSPDHADANASASTNGFGYNCHGCGLKGDAVKITMEVMNIDRTSAIAFLSGVYGESFVSVPRRPKPSRRRVFDGGARVHKGDDQQVPTGVRRRPFAGS